MGEESTVSICADECGAACCTGGAFVRREDVERLQAAGFDAEVDDSGARTRTDETGGCVLLDESNRCQAYDARPLDCRLFPLGFELDDDAECVHVVIVGCPLTDALDSKTIEAYVDRARTALSSFDADELRAYDAIPFTAEQERLETIPYEDLELSP